MGEKNDWDNTKTRSGVVKGRAPACEGGEGVTSPGQRVLSVRETTGTSWCRL